MTQLLPDPVTSFLTSPIDADAVGSTLTAGSSSTTGSFLVFLLFLVLDGAMWTYCAFAAGLLDGGGRDVAPSRDRALFPAIVGVTVADRRLYSRRYSV